MEYMQLHSDWRTCALLKMLRLVEKIYGLCSSVFRMQCISSNNCVLHIKGRTHSFIQHGLRFLLRNLLRNPRLSAQRPPWAEKCKYGAIVQLCQKWLQFPQFGQGSLNYFQCGSSLARIRGSGNPPSLQLGHPGISLKNNNKMCS